MAVEAALRKATPFIAKPYSLASQPLHPADLDSDRAALVDFRKFYKPLEEFDERILIFLALMITSCVEPSSGNEATGVQ